MEIDLNIWFSIFTFRPFSMIKYYFFFGYFLVPVYSWVYYAFLIFQGIRLVEGIEKYADVVSHSRAKTSGSDTYFPEFNHVASRRVQNRALWLGMTMSLCSITYQFRSGNLHCTGVLLIIKPSTILGTRIFHKFLLFSKFLEKSCY